VRRSARVVAHRREMATRTIKLDLSDFTPTPTQQRVLDCREGRVLFSGGYGSGKTRIGAEAVVMLALENPGCAGIVVSPTVQMLSRTTKLALRAALPRELIRHERKTDRAIDLVNGSTIFFGSADNPGSLEGTNLAWAWLDEARLMHHEAYRIIVGRNRVKSARRSQVLVTTTPAMGWLHDEFGAKRDGHERFVSSTHENAGNLRAGFVAELEATYSKRLARALVGGEFVLATGAVYEEFDEARHVIDWPDMPGVDTFLGVDFGVVSPAVGVYQSAAFDVPIGDRIIPAGAIVLVDQLVPDQTNTLRLAPLVKRLPHYRPGMVAYVDPAGGARSQAEGRSSIEILRAEGGVEPRWATRDEERYIPNGVALVKQHLDPLHGLPALYVTRRVAAMRDRRGAMATFRGYRYPERNGVQSSDQPVKDGVVDHFADQLRYAVVGRRRDMGSVGTQFLRRTLNGMAA